MKNTLRPIAYRLVVGPLQANCYVVACPETADAAVVDPGGDADRIIEYVRANGLHPRCIINTHAHPDHADANAALKARYHVPIWMHRGEAAMLSQAGPLMKLIGFAFEPSPPPDRLIEDGDELEIGTLKLRVLHTPGHSPGGICLLYGGGSPPILLSGDTVFAGSVGRTDFPGGSYDALMTSIRKKILPLPDDTVILPGHGPETTLARERASNPFFRN
jgi:glyoxylase-like metal-dependent hydrolase (beta-lactamase superfamily II)